MGHGRVHIHTQYYKESTILNDDNGSDDGDSDDGVGIHCANSSIHISLSIL